VEVEKSIIQTGSIREEIRHIEALLSLDDILEAKRVVREEIYLSAKVTDYIFALVAASREHDFILSGISTRGGINLAAAARAAAYLEGRNYVIPEDVQTIAVAVGAHRLILRPEQEGLSKEEVLQSILKSVPVPLV
jgi:MoxR-like ATPase